MVGLWRLEIRNSNQKSLLILGLIANILAQRTGGCSEAGGGTGIRTHDTEVGISALRATICSEMTGFRA
jgi:hypothetical protein